MKIHRFPPGWQAPTDYDLHSFMLDLSAPVQQILGGVVRIAAGVRSPAEGLHQSAKHELGYVLRGSLRIETELGSQVVHAGDVLSFSPARPHSTTALTDSEIFFVLLNPEAKVGM